MGVSEGNRDETAVLFVSTNPTEHLFLKSVQSGLVSPQSSELLHLYDPPRKPKPLVAVVVLVARIFFVGTSLVLLASSRYLRAKYRSHLKKVLPFRINSTTKSKTTWWVRYIVEYPIGPIVLQARAYLDRFIAALDQHKPRAIVFAEETTYNLSLYLIAEAKKRDITTVIVPFTNGIDREYLSAARRPRGHDRTKRYLSSLLFPEYSVQHGRHTLSFPIHTLFTADHFGVPAPQLWAAHLNVADEYFYTDEQDYLRATGISSRSDGLHLAEPTTATKVINQSKCSSLARGKKAEAERLVVLVLVPPDQFPLDCSFADYSSLLSHYISRVIAGLPNEVEFLASIHPRERQKSALWRSQLPLTWGLVDDVSDGLVRADLVVSYGSAINSVAEYLQIPLITYNIYGLENLDPEFPKTTTSIATRDDFEVVLATEAARIQCQQPTRHFVRRQSMQSLIENL